MKGELPDCTKILDRLHITCQRGIGIRRYRV